MSSLFTLFRRYASFRAPLIEPADTLPVEYRTADKVYYRTADGHYYGIAA